MRRMKRSAASTTPTDDRHHHVEEHREAEAGEQHGHVASAAPPSACGRSGRARPCSRPRTTSSAASEAIGRWPSSGASSSTASSTKTACTSAAIGERAPERTFVAVRAMAPVAAKPPKKGATTLPMPCAISSASGSCLRPVMPSATTAESSDSIAPSMAIAKAAGSSSRTSANESRSADRPDPAATRARAAAAAAAGSRGPRSPRRLYSKRLAMVAASKPGTSRVARAAAGLPRRAPRAAPGPGGSPAATAAARRASAGRSRDRASAPWAGRWRSPDPLDEVLRHLGRPRARAGP